MDQNSVGSVSKNLGARAIRDLQEELHLRNLEKGEIDSDEI